MNPFVKSPLIRGLGLCLFSAMSALSFAGATQAAPPGPNTSASAFAAPVQLPSLTLPLALANGKQAVDMLNKANVLDAVAKNYGLSSTHLKEMLLTDLSLNVDKAGRLLYIEKNPPVQSGSADASAQTASVFAGTVANVFRLHSRLGASKTLYLDFNGHLAENTVWNKSYNLAQINSPAFSDDADVTTFTSAELNKIYDAWKRVSEDYAMFDVDVTTEQPSDSELLKESATDQIHGARVVITKDFTRATSNPCNCGGFAYVNVFTQTTNYYSPVYVFSDNLANSSKNIAEAISHEAGHVLGLHHSGIKNPDGTVTGYYAGHGIGVTSWAPIMGNSYSRQVTQWSKGEYTGANNLEDQVRILRTQLGSRPDEDANGPIVLKAAAVSNNVAAYKVEGLLNGPTDTDSFELSAGEGNVTVSVTPAQVGANLDAKISLFKRQLLNGAVVESLVGFANPVDTLNASFSSINYKADGVQSFRVQIEPVGVRNASTGYTTYGTAGNYVLQATAANPGTSTSIYGAQSVVIKPANTSVIKGSTTTYYDYASIEVTAEQLNSTGAIPAGASVDLAVEYTSRKGAVTKQTLRSTTNSSGVAVFNTSRILTSDGQGLDTWKATVINITDAANGVFDAARSKMLVNKVAG